MRLPEENLTVEQQLEEFDYWLTAYQVIYQTTDKFKDEISDAINLINELNKFLEENGRESIQPEDLVAYLHKSSNDLVEGGDKNKDIQNVSQHLKKVFNFLFLVTASSDNNVKAQFLVRLRMSDIGLDYHDFKFYKRKEPSVSIKEFNVYSTKIENLSKILAKYLVAFSPEYNATLSLHMKLNKRFFDIVNTYISLIFENSGFNQLYYLCKAYSYISSSPSEGGVDLGEYLFRGLVTYKIRGSATAAGGHSNEKLLRKRLGFLGLQENSDFNMQDVYIDDLVEISKIDVEEENSKGKKRGFDFVLPFNIDNWGDEKSKIYMQAQFYAGDSGSVSHKVLDQTRKSRDALKAVKGDKCSFVEYLDGAGYASSLRGDLRKMLEFEDTESFIQIKSIFVRLRREMQKIDYANPTDIAQAIYLSNGPELGKSVEDIMNEDFGFSIGEVQRALGAAVSKNQICIKEGEYEIADESLNISARLMFIVDYVVILGESLNESQREDGRYLIVPGYGRAHGVLSSSVQNKITEISNENSLSFARDVETLVELGVLKYGGVRS